MQTTLEHAGQRIESPTDADIEKALGSSRDDEDWTVSLYRGEDAYMEAVLDAGALRVEATEGDRFVHARPGSDLAAKGIMVAFRDGNEAWREMAPWQEPGSASAKAESNDLTKTLIGGMIVTLGAMGGLAVLADKPGWAVVAFFLSFPGIILVAYLAKVFEIGAASSWTETTGRITQSGLAREIRESNEMERKVTVPKIEYEYQVGAQTMVGTRVNFAEILEGVQAKEARARFELGATVPVYYNPANPSEAVLERELPPVVHAALGVVAVMVAIIGLVAWFFLIRK